MALRVVHRMGNSIDLPTSAGENELLYTEDTGRLYKGTGVGKPLISFSDVVTGYATLDDLKISNPTISGKLYLTDDGVLACYNGTAYKPINDLALSNLEKALEEVSLKSHDHDNKEALDKISIDADGFMLFDGKKIEGTPSGEIPNIYLDKETYVSNTNAGNVKKSDTALSIDGVSSASPLTYYGKDVSGAIGFHVLPKSVGSSTGSSSGIELKQKVLLDVKSGQSYTILSDVDIADSNLIIQAYKFVKGSQDVISTIKAFNNTEKENFHHDASNVTFGEASCTIQNKFDVVTTINETLYETNLINKAEFAKIRLSKKGVV